MTRKVRTFSLSPEESKNLDAVLSWNNEGLSTYIKRLIKQDIGPLYFCQFAAQEAGENREYIISHSGEGYSNKGIAMQAKRKFGGAYGDYEVVRDGETAHVYRKRQRPCQCGSGVEWHLCTENQKTCG